MEAAPGQRSGFSFLLSWIAAGILAAGCGPKGDAMRAPASERSGVHGGLHYYLRSQVDPPRVTVGDRAAWRLAAELTIGAAPGPLIRGPSDSTIEITDASPPRAIRRENKTVWTTSFETRGFDIGRLPLPRVLLPTVLKGIPDTLEFPPDTLFVDSLTPAMTGAVEPDRGATPTELRPLDIVVAIAGVLALAGLIAAAIYLFLKARRSAREVELQGAAPEPPETIFLRAVAELRDQVGSLPRDRFYDRLSLAVRSYVAVVTGVPALDRTTWELERELSERGDLAKESITAAGRMLRRSDLAKFARQEDPLAEAAAALDQAVALAGRLRADQAVGPAPSSAAETPSKPNAGPPPGTTQAGP